MTEAYICDGVRTPIGRYGGALAGIRTDDLAALPVAALVERYPQTDWGQLDDVLLGCANQAGEDNRNLARMAALLAGLPDTVPGATINRLCGSGMDALAQAARMIKTGEAGLVIAGGAESMSRAPFVMPKAQSAFSRKAEIFDTTIGWRFINPLMKARFGVDSMPETAENLAEEHAISRRDQDGFALRSQQRAAAAAKNGRFDREIIPVSVKTGRGEAVVVRRDEHPRPEITLEKLQNLPALFRENGSVSAGNSSGVNDGACALLIASDKICKRYDLEPRVRIVASAVAGVAPRIMGIGPLPAMRKVLALAKMELGQMDVIEINEAFAAQALSVMRGLGLSDNAEHVNPNGGAIALGHPLGMSGARLVTTAMFELERRQARFALCTMCIGVGQGIAMVLERG